MTGIALDALLANPAQAGAYFVDARERASLTEAGNSLRFSVLPIDLRDCADVQAAMQMFADTLLFPDWFGENLDALADCLNDLSWLPAKGHVLLLDHSGDWRAHEPDTFQAVVDILNDSAAHWAQHRVPFWAFIPVSARALEIIND